MIIGRQKFITINFSSLLISFPYLPIQVAKQLHNLYTSSSWTGGGDSPIWRLYMFAKKRYLRLPGVRFKQDNNKSLDTLQMLFSVAQYISPAGHVKEGEGVIKVKLV
jgi:hypothetical protein